MTTSQLISSWMVLFPLVLDRGNLLIYTSWMEKLGFARRVWGFSLRWLGWRAGPSTIRRWRWSEIVRSQEGGQSCCVSRFRKSWLAWRYGLCLRLLLSPAIAAGAVEVALFEIKETQTLICIDDYIVVACWIEIPSNCEIFRRSITAIKICTYWGSLEHIWRQSYKSACVSLHMVDYKQERVLSTLESNLELTFSVTSAPISHNGCSSYLRFYSFFRVNETASQSLQCYDMFQAVAIDTVYSTTSLFILLSVDLRLTRSRIEVRVGDGKRGIGSNQSRRFSPKLISLISRHQQTHALRVR